MTANGRPRTADNGGKDAPANPRNGFDAMADTRLIERWLPIAALGEESVRERRSMTALPPTYYLHVWWARRPLVASRAAVLASFLPENADREKFMHAIGIHGDPVTTRRKLDLAKKSGKNLGPNPYGYKRAFTYSPDKDDRMWTELSVGTALHELSVLDPTAGGGSIPMETGRLGFAALANDLNPVAALVLRATVDWPRQFGAELCEEFEALAREFVRRAEPKYADIFPAEPDGARVEGYCGRARSRAPIARALCRCLRTGGWRRTERA